MARFRFPLATVLKLREATRDERRGQLAEAYQAEKNCAIGASWSNRSWRI